MKVPLINHIIFTLLTYFLLSLNQGLSKFLVVCVIKIKLALVFLSQVHKFEPAVVVHTTSLIGGKVQQVNAEKLQFKDGTSIN